ncbi:MAG: amidase [Candidatus Rokubacteria bacterium]|nr:amidase [Candidatus Rokubacteria bacterium]
MSPKGEEARPRASDIHREGSPVSPKGEEARPRASDIHREGRPVSADLYRLGLRDAAQAVRARTTSAGDLVRACLDRIDAVDADVQAWAYLDPEHALAQARAADGMLAAGAPLGPLHGVPVGVKDIIDTADMPTENGTVLHAGREPREDATVVAALRAAGAVILGKTVTTELAVYAPGKTRNPHDPRRTPGGSSSGSAAAVAASMVPGAIGTQTNGSVIRPASYCGVYGFKPTWGRISRHGVLAQSFHLDQVGVFARSVEDAALLAETLMIFDPRDRAMRPRGAARLAEAAATAPPRPPRLAFVKTPVWPEAAPSTVSAFAGLVARLGESVDEIELPPVFSGAVDWHRAIMEPDIAASFAREYEHGRDRLSATLRAIIERGAERRAMDYVRAVAMIPALNAALDELFATYDAIVTPATTAEAPLGLEATGRPIFCTIWTLCGVPAIALPILTGADGMPLGAQLVARRDDDARLLRTARWLAERLGTPS